MKTPSVKNRIHIISIFLLVLAGLSSVEAYPPDNAAVLYYRAFLVMKEPSEDVKQMMSAMREGKTKSSNEVKQCLEENRHAIELVETASEVPNCDWGRDDSMGFNMLLPELGKIRLMAFLLTADAQILAEKGDYVAAFGKCLTLHRMARHVGDDLIISYLVGISINNLANKRIQDFLSEMPQNLETLTWLKGQLVGISSTAASIKAAMNSEKEIGMHEIRKEKADMILQSLDADALKDEATAEAIAKVRNGNEAFFSDNRQYYVNVMTEVINVLDLPYAQSHKRLKELGARIEKDAKENPTAIMAALLTPALSRICTLGTKNATFFNAVKAAIDIYIIKARTGQWPEKLPEGLPRDIFSGEDFEYRQDKKGFVLRCRGKDLDKDEIYQYEFKVPR